ncbi:WLM domain-containing protein [Lactifluus subvellereus]|nr:WLM domain-containing protein [Lactifluus subvellereus]
MLGSTDEELGTMIKVRTVRSQAAGMAKPNSFIFHKLEPLKHLPNPTLALERLQRLSSDPAIKHVMLTNQLSVGLLTELAPHEHPNLLGQNLNAGQVIKLRLRTDLYDGLRVYSDIRRVLCHELAHNIWSDHDNNFKEFNSKLNREVAELERRARDGTRTLASAEDVYEPVQVLGLEAEVQVHVLGGLEPAPWSDESVEERRRRRWLHMLLEVQPQRHTNSGSTGLYPDHFLRLTSVHY